ncbi:aminotransferase class III-fold pyridoxal phosphate-dependent enzyme [Xenorhabdus lircayensis]|uniref:Aminotransferase class III-fold pyridoxal phosphate-dependent enzyme n=1 Tax=Xenorhabdus lircayensis TaxID=2763499 RepID=A0ABS0U6U2_9GAMM|nr:aminotransferase class III-fold pyridoxal phosphate-dependent enzyme [Xenorhabdus lircayensis]MBI6549601.1 aminotransferase class III-fold pyridoxal phosphate-dependent enzyme [Xenorhabdus lircayensis]
MSPLVGSDRYFDLNGNPILFTSGVGHNIYDQNSKEYMDFILGIGPVILGHADRTFNDVLTAALNKGLSFPGFGAIHSQVAEVFETIYPAHKVVSIFKTSSEAVTGAFRCAMLDTKRTKILRCGFLGWHDSQLYKSPSWHERIGSEKRTELRYLNGMRGVEGEEKVLNWIDFSIDSLEDTLKANGNEIAIFAIDVYQLAFCEINVLEKAISLCKAYGIKILLDETKTAGRTNAGGFLSNYNIDSDYIVMGKAIGNGLPISILMGKPEGIDIYKESRIGGTHTKETLSAAAVIAVADIMSKKDGYSIISSTGYTLVNTINDAFLQAGVNHLLEAKSLFSGSLFDIMFSDEIVNDFSVRNSLKMQLVDHGLLIMLGHNSFISLAHQSVNKDKMGQLIFDSVTQWKSAL